MAPTTSRDVYGFELNCTDEQSNIRQRCAEKQAHQAAKWAKYSEKAQLPKGEKLKKLCRKASYLFLLQIMGHPPSYLPGSLCCHVLQVESRGRRHVSTHFWSAQAYHQQTRSGGLHGAQ